MSRQIRTSAKAVIIQNGKLLAIKLNDGKEEWYILPGGGQDCEEILPRTVEREVREEAGIEPTIKKSIGKWKKVKKIFLAKKHSKASYLQIAGLRYKN